LINAKPLESIKPQPKQFESHFGENCTVVAFNNIGGDAMMVVPCPGEGDLASFKHLANFVRKGKEEQV
jgi:hypothetical protein